MLIDDLNGTSLRSMNTTEENILKSLSAYPLLDDNLDKVQYYGSRLPVSKIVPILKQLGCKSKRYLEDVVNEDIKNANKYYFSKITSLNLYLLVAFINNDGYYSFISPIDESIPPYLNWKYSTYISYVEAKIPDRQSLY